jgi:hypothetical protein
MVLEMVPVLVSTVTHPVILVLLLIIVTIVLFMVTVFFVILPLSSKVMITADDPRAHAVRW